MRRPPTAEGTAIKAIVGKTRISQNAVRRALASDSPPKYSRPRRVGCERGRTQIRELIGVHLCRPRIRRPMV